MSRYEELSQAYFKTEPHRKNVDQIVRELTPEQMAKLDRVSARPQPY